jgi:adenine-specific DNA methylase
MKTWAKSHLGLLGAESFGRFVAYQKNISLLDDKENLRSALLDFIADFSNWDNATVKEYLKTSQALTLVAHEALGGFKGTRPLVVDPFAGGGSIPLESLRVGADAFASDLNPVPVLLNKVILEYIPKYGEGLADEVRKWGDWIKCEAEKELAHFYPKDDDGAIPIAYLWARQIQCEGPGCGINVPLIRSLWLAKKGDRSVGLRLVTNKTSQQIDFQILIKRNGRWCDQANPEVKIAEPKFDGTVKRGSATCPCCGHTTPVARIREQLKKQHGGSDSSRLMCVVVLRGGEKAYRQVNSNDLKSLEFVENKYKRQDILPSVPLPLMSGVFNVPIYGITRWDLLFSLRQLASAHVLAQKVDALGDQISDQGLRLAVKVLLTISINKYLDFRTTLCGWISVGEKIGHTFGRQALGMIFDWVEGPCFGDVSGSWDRTTGFICKFIQQEATKGNTQGVSQRQSAQELGLPDDSVAAFITDPPYYNAVPYADLSDFFQIWFNKSLHKDLPELFRNPTTEKEKELCEMAGWDPIRYPNKDSKFYEDGMAVAFREGRRVCTPDGIGVIVFAHKTTSGWESLLSALIKSGWIVTGSWPIDTEREGRLRAMGSAALASSVHLVCRPRENPDGSVRNDEVGDWREVLAALPIRIHEWMPRLAEEGVVGADAIFACLGPALEIFSRFSHVEKASGEPVSLKEYLEHVWAAVAKEALSMVFQGASADGFEPDSRLTAMWLWTLSRGESEEEKETDDEETEGEGQEDEGGKKRTKGGFTLEFDAARKIAQGLGANLEDLRTLAEISGETARLLPVEERAAFLFGKEAVQPSLPKPRGRQKQQALPGFEEVVEEVAGFGLAGGSKAKVGQTVLDRVHQSMLLFGAGRSEAMKAFLVDEGVGTDARFWRLAQALSALYPRATQEKRWVDGVLARKKGLGF